MQKKRFDQILEMIDNLTFDEQEDLINIARNRQIEQRKDKLCSSNNSKYLCPLLLV